MGNTDLSNKTTLSLNEAAQLLATEGVAVRALESSLAHAIEAGRLHANIKRWATEQWDGQQLAGNINRLETFIERADLDAWVKNGGLSGR